ncbi:phosphatidylserine decarboxylase [Helicobacter didelphidarum]|uniref:phosphatidylserine decarboxylase n=1 Tax=Helicobacter didelphidarum TaxID=2040648 RepID=A0A3D8IJI7_9HELI|nr:phosphatidylserine decarboxylase [Helicobacter didelphidarum]RDU65318.1 phosphatidylserine decarboxylase [Helicobacter didelphidarum]
MAFSNQFSRLFGKIAHIRFPQTIQIFINRFYINLFKIDLSEFDSYEKYSTLNALFTRSLRTPRYIDTKPYNLISPTDSLIIESGIIHDNKALQIKGKSYSIPQLLGEFNTDFNTYSFINLYLSPRDYHHYHAPCDLEILEAHYFSGKLMPVNIPSLHKNDEVYRFNERVVLKIRMRYNQQILYYVAVGALNVGKMSFLFDDRIQTNAQNGDSIWKYDIPIILKSGEEIGTFEMGSTIVLIAQANWVVKTNDFVKMGQEIATLPDNQ